MVYAAVTVLTISRDKVRPPVYVRRNCCVWALFNTQAAFSAFTRMHVYLHREKLSCRLVRRVYNASVLEPGDVPLQSIFIQQLQKVRAISFNFLFKVFFKLEESSDERCEQ